MGRCIVAGGKPDMAAPSAGILASDLAVGSIVKLMEGGVATEYLVVNQGKPSGSTLYDDSCDGLWLLRKDIFVKKEMDATNNDYQNSDAHSYLNGEFFGLYDDVAQKAIRQVKIPFVDGIGYVGTIKTGQNGLSAKVFLLGGYEIGYTQSLVNEYVPIDGAVLSYFEGTALRDPKRIALYTSVASYWWTRSPSIYTGNTTMYWDVNQTGGPIGSGCNNSFGYRPAVIIGKNAVFDEETLLLRGVA